MRSEPPHSRDLTQFFGESCGSSVLQTSRPMHPYWVLSRCINLPPRSSDVSASHDRWAIYPNSLRQRTNVAFVIRYSKRDEHELIGGTRAFALLFPAVIRVCSRRVGCRPEFGDSCTCV